MKIFLVDFILKVHSQRQFIADDWNAIIIRDKKALLVLVDWISICITGILWLRLQYESVYCMFVPYSYYLLCVADTAVEIKRSFGPKTINIFSCVSHVGHIISSAGGMALLIFEFIYKNFITEDIYLFLELMQKEIVNISKQIILFKKYWQFYFIIKKYYMTNLPIR